MSDLEVLALPVRLDQELPPAAVGLLRETYRFVDQRWQHVQRDASPDQGFERQFREYCVSTMSGWTISQAREMGLGGGLETASGVLHEIDLVAQHERVVGVFELKNRRGSLTEKNDVIVLFAKLIDYIARNPTVLFREVCPVFLSAAGFEATGLAACLGLGVHPVAPGLRPLAILGDAGARMAYELRCDLTVSTAVRDDFDDFCARVNRLGVTLAGTWLSGRCGYLSETSVLVKTLTPPDSVVAASDDLRKANADCTRLLRQFRDAKPRDRR